MPCSNHTYGASCRAGRTAISARLVPPSTALVNTYALDIDQHLCARICASATDIVSDVDFTYVGLEVVNAASGIYNIVIDCAGTITYNPLGAGPCGSRTDIISGRLKFPATSATGIASVTLAAGPISGAPVVNGCGCGTSDHYSLSLSLLVTAVAG